MSKRPEPVMACTECGPVFTGYVTECRFCAGLPGHDVYWVDLAAGLKHEAAIVSEMAELQDVARLLTDAANELRTLRDRISFIEAHAGPDGGAKERRQGLKAARLATVIREWARGEIAVSVATIASWDEEDWRLLTDRVNERYGARHGPPSKETRDLVAQKFAQPQEAPRG